tara:strand:- start:322 stop:1311 length:990 start_codon:yes stop_codon:yes gene_type:complete
MRVIRLVVPIIVVFFLTNTFAEEHENFMDNPEVQKFIKSMQKKHGFLEEELVNIFSSARMQTTSIRLMNSQPESIQTWSQYKKRRVTQELANSGKHFIDSYMEDLIRAEDIYGVPAEVIASIIGLESRFGMSTGNLRILDTLVTLSFNYPRREKFYRSQLEDFLLLGREENIDIKKIKGSYGGAMGFGQFMPESFRKYAVDFDFDGKRDILNNPIDAIGSVANYLNKRGRWEPNTEIVLKARALENKTPTVKSAFKPYITIRELKKIGLVPASRISGNTLVVPIELEGEGGKEYWFGLKNYYALSRYNRSKLYVMSVAEFSYLLENYFY